MKMNFRYGLCLEKSVTRLQIVTRITIVTDITKVTEVTIYG